MIEPAHSSYWFLQPFIAEAYDKTFGAVVLHRKVNIWKVDNFPEQQASRLIVLDLKWRYLPMRSRVT